MTEDEKRKNLTDTDSRPEETEMGPEEAYAFIQENIKKSPKKRHELHAALAAALVGGLTFGLVSGLIFRLVDRREESQEAVISFEDVQESSAAATPTPTLSPTPSPSPTPETPEEETGEETARQQIENILSQQEIKTAITEEPRRAMVTVSLVSSTEDWFNTVNENSVSGSGIIVAEGDSNLVILTTKSVATGEGQLFVTFPNGSICEAQLRKADNATDLASIVVSRDQISSDIRESYAIAAFGNSSDVEVGEPVIAIGSPAGYADSVIFGEVTAQSKSISASDSLYTLMATNMQGASPSGALINFDGQVIGIISQSLNAEGETIIKALAISPVKNLIGKLSNNADVSYLGIYGENVSEEIAGKVGIPVGVYVTDVDDESPAYASGIQRGDIITALDGSEVRDMDTYHRILMNHSVGDSMVLTVQRIGTDSYVPIDFTVTVAAR